MARIALFGGSFNPPHVAHQMAALYALETSACDELWMVPAFEHPFQKPLAPFADRFEMCRIAARRLPGVTVSRVEADLGGASRTLVTVEHLMKLHPGAAFSLVFGADLLAERHSWYGWDEIQRRCELIVIGRAGYDGPEPKLPQISSSEIRERLRRGEDVSCLLPREVLTYIQAHGVYKP
jgi:nicotinate-nucleotide adenylyltransferase